MNKTTISAFSSFSDDSDIILICHQIPFGSHHCNYAVRTISFALGDTNNIVRSFFIVTIVIMQSTILSSEMGAAPILWTKINTLISMEPVDDNKIKESRCHLVRMSPSTNRVTLRVTKKCVCVCLYEFEAKTDV